MVKDWGHFEKRLSVCYDQVIGAIKFVQMFLFLLSLEQIYGPSVDNDSW